MKNYFIWIGFYMGIFKLQKAGSKLFACVSEIATTFWKRGGL